MVLIFRRYNIGKNLDYLFDGSHNTLFNIKAVLNALPFLNICEIDAAVKFNVVSLHAPVTKRKDTLGHAPTKFGLDMATHQGKSLR